MSCLYFTLYYFSFQHRKKEPRKIFFLNPGRGYYLTFSFSISTQTSLISTHSIVVISLLPCINALKAPAQKKKGQAISHLTFHFYFFSSPCFISDERPYGALFISAPADGWGEWLSTSSVATYVTSNLIIWLPISTQPGVDISPLYLSITLPF